MNKRGKSLIIVGLILILPALIITPIILSTEYNFSTICYNEKHSIINHEITCEVQNNLQSSLNHEVGIDLNLSNSKVVRNVEIYEFIKKSKEVPVYETVCNPYDEKVINGTLHHENCTQIQTGTKTVSYEDLEKLNINSDSEKIRWSAGELQFKTKEKRKFLIKWETPLEITSKGWGSSGNWKINPGNWWNVSWNKCKNLNVTGGANTLANFPFIVNVSFDSDMQVNFQDIRFVNTTCNNGGSEMSYEFDVVVNSSSALVWVKGNLATETNQFSMYYGNPSAFSGETPADVWSNNFTAVWHLSEGTGIGFKDSLGIVNGSFYTGTPVWKTGGDCAFGNCLWFNGSSSIRMNSSAVIQTNPIMLEFWGNDTTSLQVPGLLIPAQNDTWNDPYFSVGIFKTSATAIKIVFNINGAYTGAGSDGAAIGISSSVGYIAGGWNNVISYAYNQTKGVTTKDNTDSQIVYHGTMPIFGQDAATPPAGGEYWKGIGDEMRIQKIVRDSNWINRTIDNTNFSLFSFGAEEILDNTTPTWKDNWTSATIKTKYGDVVYFDITLEDNIEGGNWIFSFFNSIIWQNKSGNWTGVNSTKLSENETITAIKNQQVRWRWYFSDAAGNKNETPIWNFTVANSPPNHTSPLLTTPSGKNFSYENLTCYNQSTYDADNDVATNIYNWYKNSQPLLSLNLPFEVNADDYSGKDNDGTINGASFTDGKVGKSLSFDGVDDYVSIPDSSSLDVTGDLTLEVWIYPTDLTGSHTFIAKGGENWVYVNYLLRTSGDEIEFKWYNAGFETHKTTNVNLAINNWYHIVAIHDTVNNIAKIYVNGNEKLSESTIKDKLTNPRPLSIGIDRDANGNPFLNFNGSIDEVKVYPYSLSAEQIKQRYEETKDGLTSSSKIVEKETSAGDKWMCQVTPNDAEDDGLTLNSSTAEIKWAITFNVTSGETGQQLSNFDVSCNNSFSALGVNSPYEAGFLPGSYGCTFSKANYYDKTKTFTADDDKIVNVVLSFKQYLTIEEHTWLEWLYSCFKDGECRALLENINKTTTQIWQRLTGTDRSVITQEKVLSYELSSTSNITINYTIKVPYKEGVAVNELLPIRLYFWFTDIARTKCFSQDKATDTNRAEVPYCLPLVAETLGPNNGTVTFQVDLRPALAAGTYNFTRSIEIDPLGVWMQYGREDLGSVEVLDSVDADIEVANENRINFESSGTTLNEQATSQESETETTQSSKPGITGAVIGNVSGWHMVAVTGIIAGLFLAIIICQTIIRLKSLKIKKK